MSFIRMQKCLCLVQYNMFWLCVITGYGDGATGYLGAMAGNGYGKWHLIREIQILSVKLCTLWVTEGNIEDNINIKFKPISLKRELSACNDRGSLFTLFGVRENLHLSRHWQEWWYLAKTGWSFVFSDFLCSFYEILVQKHYLQVPHMHAERTLLRISIPFGSGYSQKCQL